MGNPFEDDDEMDPFEFLDVEAIGEALGSGDIARACGLIEEGLESPFSGLFRNAAERARRLAELRP